MFSPPHTGVELGGSKDQYVTSHTQSYRKSDFSKLSFPYGVKLDKICDKMIPYPANFDKISENVYETSGKNLNKFRKILRILKTF